MAKGTHLIPLLTNPPGLVYLLQGPDVLEPVLRLPLYLYHLSQEGRQRGLS